MIHLWSSPSVHQALYQLSVTTLEGMFSFDKIRLEHSLSCSTPENHNRWKFVTVRPNRQGNGKSTFSPSGRSTLTCKDSSRSLSSDFKQKIEHTHSSHPKKQSCWTVRRIAFSCGSVRFLPVWFVKLIQGTLNWLHSNWQKVTSKKLVERVINWFKSVWNRIWNQLY